MKSKTIVTAALLLFVAVSVTYLVVKERGGKSERNVIQPGPATSRTGREQGKAAPASSEKPKTLSGGQTRAPAPPVVQVENMRVGRSSVLGVKMLRHDGRPLGYFIRAERGVIVCPHFDITTLGGAGIPAATAKNWTTNGIRGELKAKILRVNVPASALGVKPGMTVEEALKRMSAPGKQRR